MNVAWYNVTKNARTILGINRIVSIKNDKTHETIVTVPMGRPILVVGPIVSARYGYAMLWCHMPVFNH